MSAMVDPATLGRLRTARGFIIDMDGTLVRGSPSGSGLVAIPGALELLKTLRTRAVPYVVFTNGTGRTAGGYAAALRSAGLPVTSREVITAADSAAVVCRRRRHERVMVLAAAGARATLRAAGVCAVPPDSADGTIDAVFAGWFPQLRFSHIQAACEAVWTGARLYSSSQSRLFATVQGRTVATSRLLSRAIQDVTGQPVEVVGKPSPTALRAAATRLSCSPADLVVVGDDPELEVPMVLRAGAVAVAVHTGIADADTFAALRKESRPHLSVPSIADVGRLL